MRMRHRFDTFDINGIELLKVTENVIKLTAQLGFFVFRKIDTSQIRYVIDIDVWFFSRKTILFLLLIREISIARIRLYRRLSVA